MKKITTLVIVLALVAGGILAIKHKHEAASAISPAKTYGMVVATLKAAADKVQLTVPYLAEVQSDSDVQLSSKVASRVESILPSGSTVKAGQVVARLDDSELKAKRQNLLLQIEQIKSDIRAKQADLENTQRNHARNRKLLASKAISQQQYDNESARIRSLQAGIEGLQQKIRATKQAIREVDDTLSYTVIESPLDGVVSKTHVATGAVAGSGKPLLSIAGSGGKFILVRTANSLHPSALIHDGRRCRLQPLHSTYNGLDEYSCHTDLSLASGSRIEVRLVVYEGKGVLLPAHALLHIDDRVLAFVRQGEHASAAPVRILAEGSEGVLVDGLAAGSEVVTAKPDILLKLLAGVPVIVRD